MQWLKAIYEKFVVPYPKISLVAAVILGAIVFGGTCILLGKQVEKDQRQRIAPPDIQKASGEAQTSGSHSPAVTGDGNNIQYDQSAHPEQKYETPEAKE
jgi:hypothetical protein